jgi:hypothetical protein
MSAFVKSAHRPVPVLTDPRSTGAPPKAPLRDLLGLRGTKRG